MFQRVLIVWDRFEERVLPRLPAPLRWLWCAIIPSVYDEDV